MPEDRGSLLQPRRDAPLSTSSTDARLAGAGLGCVCVKEHQTSSGLSKQRRSSSGAVCGLIPRELERRKRQKGKPGCFFASWGWRRSAPSGQLWQQCARRHSPVLLPRAAAPRLWASREGEHRGSQGPVSVGEGRDIKIPPALLALFEIEL